MQPRHRRAPAPSALIPRRLLLAGGPFGARLSAAGALEALARGLRGGGREVDLCPLEHGEPFGPAVREQLELLDFDARLRGARAIIIAAARLQPRTLARSTAFELATRARQGGVPAYAVAGENGLDLLDARILDLQVVLQARGPRALEAAGRELAALA